MNFYSDESEWQYLFKNGIDWDTILPLYYPSFPTEDGFQNKEEVLSFFEELLKTTGDWAGETLAARARDLDRAGGGKLENDVVVISDVLQKTYQEAKELELLGLTVGKAHGGMGAPVSLGLLGFSQLCRACLATCTQIGFHTSIADMIERFCSDEIIERTVPKIIKGELSGSMCLTEPDAGSDVGSLRTTAEKQSDGTYLLNGSKIFITNGGGGVAFVLARTKGAPEGLDGISIFFAEEWIPGDSPEAPKKHNYRVAKIEDKMGMHGSPTCEVLYENTVAHLVGKENEGFKTMLYLMNEARISVGLQGLGGMEASYHLAKTYAAERSQFGKPIAELPLMKRILGELKTELDAFRALMVDTVSYFDIFQRLHMKKNQTGDLSKEESTLLKKASKVVRLRTPLVKYYGGEANAFFTSKAIQVYGGYGFMRDYDVERIHRDCFAVLLYEGTSQIQALMAMKDFMKYVIRNPGRFLQTVVKSHPLGSIMNDSESHRALTSAVYDFRKNVVGLIMRCFRPEVSLSDNGFQETLAQVNQVFKKEYWQEAGRFDRLMIHAETLCQALSYIETLKVLARQADADESRKELFQRYLCLVKPRFEQIYADWRLARDV